MSKFKQLLESVKTGENAELLNVINEGYEVWLEAKSKAKKKKKAKSRKKKATKHRAGFGVFPDYSRATVGVECPGTDNGFGQGTSGVMGGVMGGGMGGGMGDGGGGGGE